MRGMLDVNRPSRRMPRRSLRGNQSKISKQSPFYPMEVIYKIMIFIAKVQFAGYALHGRRFALQQRTVVRVGDAMGCGFEGRCGDELGNDGSLRRCHPAHRHTGTRRKSVGPEVSVAHARSGPVMGRRSAPGADRSGPPRPTGLPLGGIARTGSCRSPFSAPRLHQTRKPQTSPLTAAASVARTTPHGRLGGPHPPRLP